MFRAGIIGGNFGEPMPCCHATQLPQIFLTISKMLLEPQMYDIKHNQMLI
jgi:hypothetical protein